MTACNQHPARERWRKVPAAAGYKVSSRGRFRSVNRVLPNGKRRKGQLMRTRPDKDGYPVVDYTTDAGKPVTRAVHAVLLEAFSPIPRKPGQESCHADDTPAHNCIENLRWDWPEGNMADRKRNNPAQPKPVRHCILCGQVVHHGGRRCSDCVQDIGYQAARALEGGAAPAEVAAKLNYPSESGVITLAVRYGGYGQRPRSPLHRVTSAVTTLRARSRGGDAA